MGGGALYIHMLIVQPPWATRTRTYFDLVDSSVSSRVSSNFFNLRPALSAWECEYYYNHGCFRVSTIKAVLG